MDFKNEVWEGKTVESLLKDVHKNSNKRSKAIDDLIKDIQKIMVVEEGKLDFNRVLLLMPLINSNINSAVKNDELVLKLISIVQKSQESNADELEGLGISELEKEQLWKDYNETVENK